MVLAGAGVADENDTDTSPSTAATGSIPAGFTPGGRLPGTPLLTNRFRPWLPRVPPPRSMTAPPAWPIGVVRFCDQYTASPVRSENDESSTSTCSCLMMFELTVRDAPTVRP